MTMFRRCSAILPLLAPAILTAQRTDTLPPVVVTATRVAVPLATAPVAVSVIEGDALRREGVTRVSDALERLPGVAAVRTGSFGGVASLFLRGGESKYVKVLVDGVPVNDPGGSFDFSTLTTDNIDRIEVVRGPASVLYGADAVTGVVQIFTRRGTGPSHATVSARAGSYGSSDATADALGTLGTASYSLDFAHHATSGIYAFNNAYRNNVASGFVTLEPDQRTRLRVGLRYSDYAYHYPTNGSGKPVDSSAVNANDLTTLSLEATRSLSSNVDAQITVASHERSGGTNQQPDKLDPATYVSLDAVRRRSVDGRVNVTVAPATTLTVGGDLERQDQRSQSDYQSGSYQSSTFFSAARTNNALYAQLLGGSVAGGRLSFAAGGRYDDNQRFGSFGTYRLGASWRLFGATRLRASGGTAFREPTFYENYSTSFTTGNHNLRPEQSHSWDIAAEQSLFDNRLTVGVTHFAQQFRNMIDYTYDTTACGASYCNVARASADGQEFEVRGAGYGLSAHASLTHLDTRVIDPGFDTSSAGLYRRGETLIRRPRTSWSAGLTYAQSSRGSVDLRLIHQGDRADRDYSGWPPAPVVLAAYTRADIGGELVVIPGGGGRVGTTLTLRVENALDTRYTETYGFLTPGRTVLAGARLAF